MHNAVKQTFKPSGLELNFMNFPEINRELVVLGRGSQVDVSFKINVV